ncbi:MAG: sigma-70 family RNA polymerase sigma factor [Pirellulaceae bacterium]|nr:sigma-70 family RNA polymerase sigma factor [Acidimicrobiia bacterium]
MDRQSEDENDDLRAADASSPGGGSHAEFIGLFAQNHSNILAYLYRLVHDRHDADDLFQRTSIVLWSKFDSFEPGSNFLAWAKRIAYLQVCNFLRTSGRDRLRFSEALLGKLADEPTTPTEESQRRLDALSKCMKELGQSDRDIVRRAYSGEQTVKEMAATFGLAVQTAYNKLGRIRKQLFDCVAHKLAIAEGSE